MAMVESFGRGQVGPTSVAITLVVVAGLMLLAPVLTQGEGRCGGAFLARAQTVTAAAG